MIKIPSDFEEFIEQRLCNAWVATAIVGSAVIGAGASIYGSSKAADAQTEAANASIAAQQANQTQIRSDFAPYRASGEGALTELNNRLPTLTAPITMDQATLEATPGYQFNKTQGLKAVQNSAAARGLGNSGAALKGAATFATGLADNTYQNQFNNANTNNTNAYNRLKGLVDVGQASSAQTATAGINTANQTSSALSYQGNAQAAGFNAQAGAVTNAANTLGGYANYKGLYGGGGSFGGSQGSPFAQGAGGYTGAGPFI